MADRASVAREAGKALRAFKARQQDLPVMVGFDGFVDSIIQVVDRRHDTERYDPMPTIDYFGSKIKAAAGESANFELVTTLRKLGGNGPIMANAMAAAGQPVTYVGALGHPTLDPVFEDFASVADVYSFCDPGFTDALEFSDGKLMLGKHDTLRGVNADQLKKVVGVDMFRQIVARSAMLGMVNWTMLTQLETIWNYLADEVLAEAPDEVAGRRRLAFIDLADPVKRTIDDIKRALGMITKLDGQADVILGLNLSEAKQIAAALGLDVLPDGKAAVAPLATAIQQALGIYCVVVHPRTGAAATLRDGTIATFEGPFVKQPKLSTGAGDNFNAGFCLGTLADLPLQQRLCVGTATSGFYVREARSPRLDELADFCDDLPAPESA